ncbi:MAG: DMT family transporter [Clostridiaceae bacterium]|nr:DMT family transporter [Clostridiaceae bacterium]
MSLLITAILWGGGFIGVKDALATIEPLHLTAIRFSLAGIILSIIFFKRLKQIKRQDLYAGLIIGLLLFAGFVTQTIGLKYTTAGKNAFLTGLNVVMVPFFYWALKKKFPGLQTIAAAILSFLGIGLLTLQNGSIVMNFGDLMTIICAVFFAIHITAIGHFSKDCDTVVLAILQMIVAAVLSIVCAVLFEPKMPLSNINSGNIYSIGYLVIFSTMIAFLIQNTAQKYTMATHAAIILCMESVFGSIFSVIFLKEIFSPTMIIGCVVIFVAIILSEVKIKFRVASKNKKMGRETLIK